MERIPLKVTRVDIVSDEARIEIQFDQEVLENSKENYKISTPLFNGELKKLKILDMEFSEDTIFITIDTHKITRNFKNDIQLEAVSDDSIFFSKDKKSVFTEFPILLKEFEFDVPSIESTFRATAKGTSIGTSGLVATSFFISSSQAQSLLKLMQLVDIL